MTYCSFDVFNIFLYVLGIFNIIYEEGWLLFNFFFLYSCEHGYACAIVAENSFFPWLLFLLLNGFCYNLTDLRLDFFKVM